MTIKLKYLLSGNVSVGAGRRTPFRLAVRRYVQEIPDENRVIVRAADDLELIEL